MRKLLRRGQAILVAVSGGLDSMVLLHVLHELSLKNGWRLTIAHLNHQLRGRHSDADERLVWQSAKELRLPIRIGCADVRRFARGHNLSVEMAARKLRHDFLARVATQRKISTVALAHHADDQLELFFLRLFRGSGGEGLAGMKWRNHSPANRKIELVRPFLDQPKSILHEYAAEKKIRFREDATNAALDIQRNRIRHELLPLLREKYQPALDKVILRVTDIIAAETECVGDLASICLDGMRNKKSRSVQMPTGLSATFEELPVAVQRRCIQSQLFDLGVSGDYDLVEKLRSTPNHPVTISASKLSLNAKVAADVRRRTLFPGKLAPTYVGGYALSNFANDACVISVFRDPHGFLHPEHGSTTPEFNVNVLEVGLEKPPSKAVFDGVSIRWQFDSKKARAPKSKPNQEFFDADEVGQQIILRHWRPGDRFKPIGMAIPLKLQDFFTNQKISRNRRRQLIVATTAEGELFWVEGLRISERFKLTKDTIRRLQWRWQRL